MFDHKNIILNSSWRPHNVPVNTLLGVYTCCIWIRYFNIYQSLSEVIKVKVQASCPFVQVASCSFVKCQPYLGMSCRQRFRGSKHGSENFRILWPVIQASLEWLPCSSPIFNGPFQRLVTNYISIIPPASFGEIIVAIISWMDILKVNYRVMWHNRRHIISFTVHPIAALVEFLVFIVAWPTHSTRISFTRHLYGRFRISVYNSMAARQCCVLRELWLDSSLPSVIERVFLLV